MDIKDINKSKIQLKIVRDNNRKMEKYIKASIASLDTLESGVLHTYAEHTNIVNAINTLNVIIARNMTETIQQIADIYR